MKHAEIYNPVLLMDLFPKFSVFCGDGGECVKWNSDYLGDYQRVAGLEFPRRRRGRDGDTEVSQDRLGDPVIHSHTLTGDKLPCFRHFADFVRRSGLNPENSCSGFQHRGGDFTHPRDIATENIEISHATPSHPHLLIGGMYPYMPRGGA